MLFLVCAFYQIILIQRNNKIIRASTCALFKFLRKVVTWKPVVSVELSLLFLFTEEKKKKENVKSETYFATPSPADGLWEPCPLFWLLVPGYSAATGTNSCAPKGKQKWFPPFEVSPPDWLCSGSQWAFTPFCAGIFTCEAPTSKVKAKKKIVKGRNISLWSFEGMTSSLHSQGGLSNQPQQELIFYFQFIYNPHNISLFFH